MRNKFLQDIKEALAFAVGIGNTIMILYFLIKIWFVGYVVIGEPSNIILLIEIIVSLIGVKLLWNMFHKNKETRQISYL